MGYVVIDTLHGYCGYR